MKVRISDLLRIKADLKRLGARQVKVDHQKDRYFTSPIVDFDRTGEVLRIREESPAQRGYITYKGPKLGKDIKTREEIEVSIGEGALAALLLKKLGFRVYATVEKERLVYEFDDFSISLDRVKGLGTFMEIELKIPDEERKKEAEEKIYGLLDKLQTPRKAS